jgi:DUF971 family protein
MSALTTVQPTRVKQQNSSELLITWNDGHVGPVSLRTLRDECPCAECKGETVLLRSYSPGPAAKDTPGFYELNSASAVGGYAIQFSWGDGHRTGIYTWEHLRSLCECGECFRIRGG